MSLRRWSALAVATVGALLTSSRVHAQSAVFRGAIYRDSLRNPLAGVVVELPDMQERAVTNDSGRFQLRSLPAGTWRVTVRRVGYDPIEDSVHIISGREIVRDYVMTANSQRLDAVVVNASRPKAVSPAMRGFEERRAGGFGHFLTPADLRKAEGRKLTEILRGLPGTTVYSYRSFRFIASGRGLSSIPDPRSRGAGPGMEHAIRGDQSSPVACWTQIILDGIRIYSPNSASDVPDISSYEAKEFEAIEFYGGPASTPSQFSGTGATCATLVLWSRERV